jgi:DNA-binding response OmpR family regulator
VTRILIADDDAMMRLLIDAAIEADGYEVLESANGDEAWALLREHRPEIALLDVQMGGRTGLELTSQIRADRALAGTAVIIISAKTGQSDVAAGYAAGADHYVTKPFSPNALAEIVRSFAARAGRRAERREPGGRGDEVTGVDPSVVLATPSRHQPSL